MIKWDGLDTAIIGTAERCGMTPVLCYSYDKCIQAFMDQGMSDEEAIEWIDFNVLGAYVGELTPIILMEEL